MAEREHEIRVDLTAELVVKAVSREVFREAIERVTGPDGQAWRAGAYDLYTEQDVLEHWAHNAAANGVQDVCELDGWADLERGSVRLSVDQVRVDA